MQVECEKCETYYRHAKGVCIAGMVTVISDGP